MSISQDIITIIEACRIMGWPALMCNRCYRPMKGSTAYDGACECGGLITVAKTRESNERLESACKTVGRLTVACYAR